MHRSVLHLMLVFAICSLVLPGCGGGSGGAAMGTLNLKITDAPFPATEGCVSAATIVVTEASAKGPDGFVVLLDATGEPLEIDLFQLRGIS